MEELGKVIGYMKGVDEQIGQINKEIYGNGRPGIRERLTRTEESVERLVAEIKELKDEVHELKELVGQVSKDVGAMAKTVDKHLCDRDLHTVKGLFLASWRDVVIWGTLLFVVLHTFISAFHLDPVEIIKKLVGLP